MPRHVTSTSVSHNIQVIYTSFVQGITQVVNRKERKFRKLRESPRVAKNNSRCGHMAIRLEKGSMPRCLSEDSEAQAVLREDHSLSTFEVFHIASSTAQFQGEFKSIVAKRC